MSRDIEMKQHVLNMLKEHLLGEEGKKFKPKAIEVEMIGKPKGMAEGGLVYDTKGESGWEKPSNEHLTSEVDEELAEHARGGEDYETHSEGWADGEKHAGKQPDQFSEKYDPEPKSGWAKSNEEKMADGGMVGGEFEHEDNEHVEDGYKMKKPKMSLKEFLSSKS